MITFHQNVESFADFSLNLVESNSSSSSTIFVADPSLFTLEILDRPPSSKQSVAFINKFERTNVVLVESLSELIDILKRSSYGGDTDVIRHHDSAIGFYGIFLYLLQMGCGVSDDVSFMDMEDFSAQSVNYIMHFLYNLAYYRKIEVRICETKKGPRFHENTNSYPPFWYNVLPNIFCETVEDDDMSMEIEIGVILSKWVQNII